MTDLAFFALFFAAIAIGWALGRRHPTPYQIPGHYFGGQARTDRSARQASDAIVDALAADGDSPRNHIAMGVQLRRKGEVEGAVRIHQELLARPGLPADDAALARLELARDFISAGLLDRAEELLLELVERFPGQRQAGRRHLLEVYEIERDWRRAIDVAKALLPSRIQRQGRTAGSTLKSGQRAALLLAHYCCELAEEERVAGDLDAARKLLQDALSCDKQCARASILLGKVECDGARYRQAVLALRRVRVQDPAYLPETIELLRKCYTVLGETQSLRDYLTDCLATHPTPTLVAAVAEDMVQAEGGDAASAFLAAQLLEFPSLAGLAQLIGLQLEAGEGKSRENLVVLQGLAQRLVAARPTYRCSHCGFAGKHLHWNCPGCKHWGSIMAIEGDGSH